ncbi:MAG: class I tRNA ligase family protein, partial [Candidatus Gracilibacteria bacterium]|nr:class I tRNA ligase family protein [Candidatus Gracilibacteria bacterium]
IVGHKGTFRAICKYLNNLTDEETYFEKSSNVDFGNASFVKLANYKKENNLDKWIIAELQELIKEVTNKLDNYDLQSASDPIATFLDKLTNWYIRRSRRRFWKSENDGDKMEAYNTLYEVLVELSKTIAPFMPFVSEEIFKGLTAKKSVHLEYWPEYNEAIIIGDLTHQMDKTQKIVNLGLALRADKKIRVRQPLNSISITEKLEDYYLEIIKEELNIKEVIYLADSSAIARKVCRPNAKLIGPKFGKDVQAVIVAAKSGDFKEIGEGKIKVGNFILEANEYEIAFEPTNLELDIEANFGMVIAMDTQVTESLRNEGYARDLVRVIQDARKESGYNVSDRINISINGSNLNFIEDFKDYIESETLSKIEKFENGDINKEVELEDDWKVEVVLRKWKGKSIK